MDTSEFELHARIEDSHWWFRARRKIIGELIDTYTRVPEGSRLLEIGCGTGGNLRYFARKYRTWGIEPDKTAAALARTLTSCDIVAAGIHDLSHAQIPTPDVILLADVLEHIDDDRAAIAAAVDFLAPGGVLVATVPADPRLWSGHDVALGHRRRYTAASLARLVDKLPARPVFSSAFNTFLYPAVRLSRALKRADAHSGSDLKPHSRLTNALLYRVFAAEALLLKRWSFATGCSLITILAKEAP